MVVTKEESEIDLLVKIGFPIENRPELTKFLVTHINDVITLSETRDGQLFLQRLICIYDSINEQVWTLLVKIFPLVLKHNLITFFLPFVSEFEIRIRKEPWFFNGLMQILRQDNGTVTNFFRPTIIFGLHKYIDEQSWNDIVSLFLQNSSQACSILKILPKVMSQTKLSLQDVLLLVKDFPPDIFTYFDVSEVFDFFIFTERVLRAASKIKLDILYAIDRSGRILGFLLYTVFSNLGFPKGVKGIKCYYLHELAGKVTLYSEKQKKEISGKNILVVDEYVSHGDTVRAVMNALMRYVITPDGKGNVYVYAFSSWHPQTFFIDNPVSDKVPSWFSKKEYAGVQEKTGGGVILAVDKGARSMAWKVRKALSQLAVVIAEYLRMKGY